MGKELDELIYKMRPGIKLTSNILDEDISESGRRSSSSTEKPAA
jgi:hypothetical protein